MLDCRLISCSVKALAKIIHDQNYSPMDIINIFIEWTNHLNKKLNSVIKFDEKSAEIASLLADIEYEDKHSLLMRIIPFTVKDTFDTKGIVSSAGTSGRRNYVPREDATVVGRLKEAGAVLLGKFSRYH